MDNTHSIGILDGVPDDFLLNKRRSDFNYSAFIYLLSHILLSELCFLHCLEQEEASIEPYHQHFTSVIDTVTNMNYTDHQIA